MIQISAEKRERKKTLIIRNEIMTDIFFTLEMKSRRLTFESVRIYFDKITQSDKETWARG